MPGTGGPRSERTRRAIVGTARSAFAAQGLPSGVDTGVAHIARMQNYLRGGTDNFAAGLAAAEHALAAYPDLVSSVRANQAFLGRAVRFLAGEAGIRQFLDLGAAHDR